MRVGLLQLNPVICDFKGNCEKIFQAAQMAFEAGADFCVTPELAVIGYPPDDLILREDILVQCVHSVKDLAIRTKNFGPLLVGTPWRSGPDSTRLYNAACLLADGRIDKVFSKTLLPEYDVFYEKRYFASAQNPGVFEFMGRKIGVTICEDVWNDPDFWGQTGVDGQPVRSLCAEGAQMIINLSASPFSVGKHRLIKAMLGSLSAKYNVDLLFCNQVGGFDDLVFSGRSMAFDAHGRLTASALEFAEDVLVVDTKNPEKNRLSAHDLSSSSEIWQALVLGTADYVRKSGFNNVLVGLSGGLDSSVTAAVAVQALGCEQVTGVLMPSPYSSPGSIEHSLELAANLGIKTHTLPISELMQAYDLILAPIFKDYQPDVTEENIQARIRANLLMAMSNKQVKMLLATGNKSEMAVGYSTIYGDMAGGLAVLADVAKTSVYKLADWLNKTKNKPFIPREIIAKPPSAELRPGQMDRDTLPEYEILDPILSLYIEKGSSFNEICALGHDPDLVQKIMYMVDRAEFKRSQAPPGIRITEKAFGRGRRMPLTAKCVHDRSTADS